MARYLITQSLVAAWAYMFDCREGYEEEAKADFLRVLRRESGETTEAMQNGIDFENAVYATAAGAAHDPDGKWARGIRAVAQIVRGAQVQVRLSRPVTVDGTEYLVYGVLDALKAGVISDVKFSNKPLSGYDAYGKYLNSPQHPFYLYLVPEAREFQYLLSDGDDLYIERYQRGEVRSAESVIAEFTRSLREMGLLDLYKEKWVAA